MEKILDIINTPKELLVYMYIVTRTNNGKDLFTDPVSMVSKRLKLSTQEVRTVYTHLVKKELVESVRKQGSIGIDSTSKTTSNSTSESTNKTTNKSAYILNYILSNYELKKNSNQQVIQQAKQQVNQQAKQQVNQQVKKSKYQPFENPAPGSMEDKYNRFLIWGKNESYIIGTKGLNLTFEEFKRLMDEYGSELIVNTIKQIDNRRDHRNKYTSLNLTLRNWIKNGYNTQNNE